MVARLGATFLVGAIRPVNFAGSCLFASEVPDGLAQLSAENLLGGVTLGVAQAARRAGVSTNDVERLLPMQEIRSIIARIGRSQQQAAEAWLRHTGPVGGVLKGVTDLTVDGRAPDVGLCLERLANKMSRDTELAEPLRALAVDITSFQDIIVRCRHILDDGNAFEKAYRRRRLRQILIVSGSAVVALIALTVGLSVRAAQGRIDEALARPDPCAINDIATGDLGRSTSSQKQKVEERRGVCQANREREELARKEATRKETEAREAERQRKEHVAKCDSLATHLAGGKLLPEDEVFAGDKAALLRRVARGSLLPADLGPADPSLPCGDTPSGAQLGEAFSRAVRAVPSVWANAPDPSPVVRAALIQHARELPSAPKQVLASRAADAAKRARLVGRPGDMERAFRLCDLALGLGVGGGPFCPSVLASAPKTL